MQIFIQNGNTHETFAYFNILILIEIIRITTNRYANDHYLKNTIKYVNHFNYLPRKIYC